jgi:hypothetical protein
MRSDSSGNNVSTGERQISVRNMVRLDPEKSVLSYLGYDLNIRAIVMEADSLLQKIQKREQKDLNFRGS